MRFATAQKKGVEYLDSDEFKSREDAETTLSSIPILKQMNKKGIVTTGSQEGLILKGYNPDSQRYYEIRERAFVDGIMKKKDAHEFITKINEMTDKVGLIIRNDPSKEYKKLFDSGEKIPTLPVTIQASATTKAGISEFHYATSMPLALPSQYFDTQYKEISDPVELVVIVDPVYGRKATSAKGLYKDILNVLAAI